MKKIILFLILITSLFSNTNGYIKYDKNIKMITPFGGYYVEYDFMQDIVFKAENYDILKSNETIYQNKIMNRDYKIDLLEKKIELLKMDSEFLHSQNTFLTNQIVSYNNELINNKKFRFNLNLRSTLITIVTASSFILGWVLSAKYK